MDYVKKEYNNIRKKYTNLPKYEKFDAVFEISTLDDDRFLLRNVRRRVMERSEYFIKILESLIQPENNFVELIEFKCFNPDDKSKISEVLQKFKILEKKSLIAAIAANDDENVDFIIYAYDMWYEIKSDFMKIAKKLEECWSAEDSVSEKMDYLG